MSDVLIGTLGLTSFFFIQKNMTKQQLMERAKREEAAALLVETAFHKCLAEEKLFHERQQEVFCKLSVGLGGRFILLIYIIIM
jgi:hypothetical protein